MGFEEKVEDIISTTEEIEGIAEVVATVQAPAIVSADLGQDEIPLPNFVVRREDGLFVDLDKLESSERFEAFVERSFSGGYYFTGLDYGLFLELLTDFTLDKIGPALKRLEEAGKSKLIRFSTNVVEFSTERRALYQEAIMVGDEAEYMFEPAVIERTIEEEVLKPSEGDGSLVVTIEQRVVSEPTKLIFDEFVSAIWASDVHYGIDVAGVQKIIDSGKSGRIVVARPLKPIQGSDAGIVDQTDALHRDDAPMVLPNGKVDLRHFKNHFPQIRGGARLLKKTPRVLGTTGWSVEGAPIEPPLPKDIEFGDLAGQGTQMESTKEGDFIVALMDGFLSIDTETSRISVSEKIVNTTGVSARMTGDLVLNCDEYEEHGEIQEGRVVEGRSITVFADVFGSLISTGGKIHLKQNLVRGSATNRDGDITIDGLVSGSVLHAKKGVVFANRAENCIIVGRKVEIETAVNCAIYGEEVEVGMSEGCAVAGKSVRIAKAGPRQQSETVVSMLIPDLAEFDQKISALGRKIEQLESAIAKKRQATEAIMGQPEVKSYMMLAVKVQKKEITLTPEQQGNLQKLAAKVSPDLKTLAKINEELKELQSGKKSLDGEIAAIVQVKQETSAGISCSIAHVLGDTLVRTMKTKSDTPSLADLAPKDMKAKLHAPGQPTERIRSGTNGPLDWKFFEVVSTQEA
jgi:hypothetical protein